jgi:hypothetical protein
MLKNEPVMHWLLIPHGLGSKNNIVLWGTGAFLRKFSLFYWKFNVVPNIMSGIVFEKN